MEEQPAAESTPSTTDAPTALAIENPEPRLPDLLQQPATYVGLAWVAFQVYAVLVGFLPSIIMGAPHLGFALALALLGKRTFRQLRKPLAALDLLLALGALASIVYVQSNFRRYELRIPFVDALRPNDVLVGLGVILLTLIVAVRTVGWPMTIVALVFLAYGFAGPLVPGPLAHRGIDLNTFVELDFLSSNGLFGVPLGVSAEVVFYFVLFGVLLERSGGGQLFVDIAYSITGRARGGSAKASVISSALFGTTSGSAVANVVIDGIFTIPLMKRTGFQSHFAAAVEAAASTGGQLMPPVMGAAAFILAQYVGVSYAQVALAAVIPAVLYYVSLYVCIDLEARRLGIRAIPRHELPDVKAGLKARAHLLLPLGVLIFFLARGADVAVAALWASLAVLLVSFLRRTTWLSPARMVDALVSGAREAIAVALPTAVAGLIIGVVVYTGLALKFTAFLQSLASGQLPLALVLVMLACLVLGMGMPTSAAYLMAAILMAPALQALGVQQLAAHLFIFYFGVISMVTPPVALAAFAAASIAGSSMWQTGWTATRLSIAGFLIPFAFVYNPAIILIGPLPETVWRTLTTTVGLVALAAGLVGYLLRALSWPERLVVLAAAALLITPEQITDLVGLALFGGFILYHRARGRIAVPVPADAR